MKIKHINHSYPIAIKVAPVIWAGMLRAVVKTFAKTYKLVGKEREIVLQSYFKYRTV